MEAMNKDRAIRMLSGLMEYLEGMDGEDLRSKMAPKAVEIEVHGEGDMPKDGPMDKLMADAGEKSEAPPMPEQVDDGEEMDDDDFEEMMKLSK